MTCCTQRSERPSTLGWSAQCSTSLTCTTGDATLIGSTGTNTVQGMAFSPEGILYGLDGLARLGIIDVTDGTITPVGDAPQNFDLNSLGFRTDGVLYAAGNNLSELYTLNPDTGVATLVGTGEFSNLRGLDYIPGSSTLPPRVACAVDVMTLDPPNGDMVDIGLKFDVRAGDDPSPSLSIAVFANEGDGDDASFTVDGLTLRAKRSGDGTGRVYLILVAAIDNEGQAGIDCCTVVVPHDSSTAALISVATEADLAELTCRETGLAPEGFMMIEVK